MYCVLHYIFKEMRHTQKKKGIFVGLASNTKNADLLSRQRKNNKSGKLNQKMQKKKTEVLLKDLDIVNDLLYKLSGLVWSGLVWFGLLLVKLLTEVKLAGWLATAVGG